MKIYTYKQVSTNWTSLLACVGGTLLLTLTVMLFSSAYTAYGSLTAPALTPNVTLFKILHLTVFALYGYALHRVIITPTGSTLTVRYKKISVSMWMTGLIIAAAWLPLFFSFELYMFTFIWIAALSALCAVMIILNYRIDKLAALSLVPCTIWLMFTTYLNLFIAIMN